MSEKKPKLLQQIVAMVLCLCLGAGTIISSGYASATEPQTQEADSEWGGVNSENSENTEADTPGDVETQGEIQAGEDSQTEENAVPPENDGQPLPEENAEPTPEEDVVPEDVTPDGAVPEDAAPEDGNGEIVEPEVPVDVQLSVKKSVEMAEDESLRLRYEAWVDTVEEQERIADTGFTVLLPEGQTWDWELSDPDGQIGYFDVNRDEPEWETYVGDILDPVQGNEIWTDAVVWVPQEGKIQPDSYVYFVDVPEGVQDVSELNPVLFVADGKFVDVKYESDWENAELLTQPEDTPEPTVTPAEAAPSPEEPPVQEEQQPLPDDLPDTSESDVTPAPTEEPTPTPEEELTPTPEFTPTPELTPTETVLPSLSVSRSIVQDEGIFLKYSVVIPKKILKEISSSSPLIALFPKGQMLKDGGKGDLKVIGSMEEHWNEVLEYLGVKDDGAYSCAAVMIPDGEVVETAEYLVSFPGEADSIEMIDSALFFVGEKKVEVEFDDNEDELKKEIAEIYEGNKTIQFIAPSAPNPDAVFVFIYHFEYPKGTSTSAYPPADGQVLLSPNETKSFTVPLSTCQYTYALVKNLMEGYVFPTECFNNDWMTKIAPKEPYQAEELEHTSQLTLIAPSVSDEDAIFTFDCYLMTSPTYASYSCFSNLLTIPGVENLRTANRLFVGYFDQEQNERFDERESSLAFTVKLKSGETFVLDKLASAGYSVDVVGQHGDKKYMLNRSIFSGWTGYEANMLVNPTVIGDDTGTTKYSVKFEKLINRFYSGLPGSGYGGIFSHQTEIKYFVDGAVLRLEGKPYVGDPIEPIEWTTDSNVDKYIVLSPGIYTLKEIKPPEGYFKAPDLTFELENDGTILINGEIQNEQGVDTFYETFYNDTPGGYFYGEGPQVIKMYDTHQLELIISKYSYYKEHGDVPLYGATFEISGFDFLGTEVHEKWISNEEPFHIMLSPGRYTIRETAVPDERYKKIEDITIQIDDPLYNTYPPLAGNGRLNVTFISGDENDYEYFWDYYEGGYHSDSEYDDPDRLNLKLFDQRDTVPLKIIKTSYNAPGTYLKGATLQITGTKVSQEEISPIQWTTDGNPYVLELEPGNYVLSEISVPPGYTKADDIRFRITEGFVLSVSDGSAYPPECPKDENNVYVITMNDEPVFEIPFNKISSLNPNIYIIGATLKLTGKTISGKTVETTWVTDSETHIENLVPGTYTLTETQVPEGCMRALDIHFTVGIDGKITIDGEIKNSVDMIDEQHGFDVSFNKYSLSNPDSYVVGATLNLTGELDSGDHFDRIVWVTGSETHIENLPPGSYTLHELEVPFGYGRADDIHFTVDNEGTVKVNGEVKDSIDMYDEEYEPGQFPIKFEKVMFFPDSDEESGWYGFNIDGAVLQISGKAYGSSTDIEPIIVDKTKYLNKEPVYLFPGNYILTEIKAPAYYDFQFTEGDSNGSPGCKKADDIHFSVTMDGNVEINGTLQKTPTVTMENEQLLYITKWTYSSADYDYHPAVGAVLKICGSGADGNPNESDVIERWTTNAEEKFYYGNDEFYGHAVYVPKDKLRDGVWLIEESAPYGFEIAEPKCIGLTRLGSDKGNNGLDEFLWTYNTYPIAMYDEEAQKYDIPFNKFLSDGHTYLPGATLQITSDAAGFEPITWQTDGTTHTVSLYPGTFTLKEISAPEGYIKANDIVFTITNDGEILIDGETRQSIDMVDNEEQFGDISIVKRMKGYADDDYKVSQRYDPFHVSLYLGNSENVWNYNGNFTGTYSFEVTGGTSFENTENDSIDSLQQNASSYDGSGNEVRHWTGQLTVGKNGCVDINLQVNQKITIRKIPSWLLESESSVYYTVKENADASYNPEITNEKGTLLKDKEIEITIRNEDGNKHGSLQIAKIVYGNDSQKSKKYGFEVSISGDDRIYPYVLKESNGNSQTGEFKSVNGKFSLQLSNGESVVINNIPENRIYTVTETDSGDLMPFSGSSTGYVSANSTSDVNFVNSRPIIIRIRKVDENNNDILDVPAEFKITEYKSKSTVVSGLRTKNTSVGDGTWALSSEVSLSQPGDYYFTETLIPTGYDGIDLLEETEPGISNCHITVKDDMTITEGGEELYGAGMKVYFDSTLSCYVVQIQNIKQIFKYTVKVAKMPEYIDGYYQSGLFISGVQLQITGKEKHSQLDITPVEWTTSDAEGLHEVELFPGNYTLKELSTPVGYETAADIQFEVTDDGKVLVGGVEQDNLILIMYDPYKEVKFRIRKVDENGNDILGYPAEFEVKDTLPGTGFSQDPLQTKQVDVNGDMQALTDEFTLPHPGRLFSVRESKVPVGYLGGSATEEGSVIIGSDDTDFTVQDETHEDYRVYHDDFLDCYVCEIRNTKKTIKLRIRKVDQNGEDILGNPAEFTMTGEEADLTGQTLHTADTVVESETWALSEEIVFDKAGAYSFTETDSPDGYTALEHLADGSLKLNVTDDMSIDTGDVYGEGVKVYFDDTLSSYILEITNNRNTGPLTISKTVEGSAGETERLWTFTVALSGTGFDKALEGTYDYTSINTVIPQSDDSLTDSEQDGTGTITFASGTATFSLKSGQSITITGLPQGITYTVTEKEADQDGYTTTSTGDTGSISEAESTASFTNTKQATAILPDSGGPGKRILLTASLMLMFACLAFASVSRKYK